MFPEQDAFHFTSLPDEDMDRAFEVIWASLPDNADGFGEEIAVLLEQLGVIPTPDSSDQL